MAEGRLRTIVVTAGDTKVMPALQGLTRSLEAFPHRQDVEIGCLDVGQDDAGRAWPTCHGVLPPEPTTHLGAPESRLKPDERAFVTRTTRQAHRP